MTIILTVLIFFICFFLVIIVLIQNSKGGGLAANMGFSNQLMGVRRTTDFLEKATWTLAGGLMVLSLLAGLTIGRGTAEQRKSKIEEQVNATMDPAAMQQNFPTAAPGQDQQQQQQPAQQQPAN